MCDLAGSVNWRANQHARIIRARRKHGSDQPEREADDRPGDRDRRRNDGGGSMESVGSNGDRLGASSNVHIVVAGRMIGPVDDPMVDVPMVDVAILNVRSRRPVL